MPRRFRRSSGGLVIAAALFITGCRTYESEPLDPADILQTLETRRRVDAPAGVVELAYVVDLARERSPSLLTAREAEATARALADLPTPLPNPSLDVGPILLSGPGIGSATRWGFEAVGGWMLDLNGNRAAATELRGAEARAAAVELAVRERGSYLALRRGFVALVSAERRASALAEAEAGARSAAVAVRRMVDAGQASALDVTDLDVEAARAAAAILSAREAAGDARAALSAEAGITSDLFTSVEAPEAPTEPPSRESLIEMLASGHPDLDALRAEYDVAEAHVRTVVAARYPGVELGPGYEYEEKTDRYSLGLGFELPIFDRGDLEITAAEGERSNVRARYEATLTRLIGDVEAALSRLTLRRARHALLTERVAPAARRGLDLARRGLESGALDGLRYLHAVRTEREVRLDVAAAEGDVLDAWCDLESACGAPLLQFASTLRETTEGDAR